MAALERDPNNPAALYGCAVVMKEQQQLNDCIEYLTRALAVDAEHARLEGAATAAGREGSPAGPRPGRGRAETS